ncbi:MAG: transposase [Brevinematales bacterium]|nr:transposase [Brevinematales bacterium]
MKAFVFKLYRSKNNKTLHQTVNIAGIIYNYCIAVHKKYYGVFGKSLSANRLKVHLTKLKKRTEYEYWKKVGSQAIQDIVERIDRAYSLFFSNLKRKVKCAPPSFKKVKKYRSFTLKQAGYNLFEDNRIRIGKKVYKYSKSREIEGKIKTVTIKRDTIGDLYICVITDFKDDCPVRLSPNNGGVASGKMAGADFGLKTFLTLSDGTRHESPEFYKQSRNEMKKASRELSSKKDGSNNRKKAKLSLARVHQNISNRRKDHHYKLALELCRKYDVIYFEDLNLKGMKALWGRKVSDFGFYSFLKILEHIAGKYGTEIRYIGRFEPSSKTCSVCGYIYEGMTLREREWECPECGTLHDRDLNAANNILKVGASTFRGEDVRPAQAG